MAGAKMDSRSNRTRNPFNFTRIERIRLRPRTRGSGRRPGRGRGFEPRRPRHTFQMTYGAYGPKVTTKSGHNKILILHFEPVLSNQLCPRSPLLFPRSKPSSLQPCLVRLACERMTEAATIGSVLVNSTNLHNAWIWSEIRDGAGCIEYCSASRRVACRSDPIGIDVRSKEWIAQHLVDEDGEILGAFPFRSESLNNRSIRLSCRVAVVVHGGDDITLRGEILAEPVSRSWI